MKEITNHKIENNIEQIIIMATDEPSFGNAYHQYEISMGADTPPLIINFQKGPIKEFGVNGIKEEILLSILIDRLESFQNSAFACVENGFSLSKIKEALWWLQQRTIKRIQRNVEGTNNI